MGGFGRAVAGTGEQSHANWAGLICPLTAGGREGFWCVCTADASAPKVQPELSKKSIGPEPPLG